MKFRNSRPLIAASIGRMIALSIPSRPDASPAKNADTASAHPAPVTPAPSAEPPLQARRRPVWGRSLDMRHGLAPAGRLAQPAELAMALRSGISNQTALPSVVG